MNLYEAIFVRKSVRSYLFEEISDEVLGQIKLFFQDTPGMIEQIAVDMEILDNRRKNVRQMSLFGVSAPYYLAFYSEKDARYYMNIGYMMQQVSLYLCRIGLGSCILGSTRLKKEFQQKGGKQLIGLMAFGKSKGSCLRKATEARRLPLEELCVFKETPDSGIRKVLEAARMAPSALNAQPWRFIVFEKKIHIFSKKYMNAHFQRLGEIDFGILFANMMIASDELWLDMDLIKLENIALKYFPNNAYVLSAIKKSE